MLPVVEAAMGLLGDVLEPPLEHASKRGYGIKHTLTSFITDKMSAKYQERRKLVLSLISSFISVHHLLNEK